MKKKKKEKEKKTLLLRAPLVAIGAQKEYKFITNLWKGKYSKHMNIL